ncbi:MAG: hypothetical protein ACE365_00310 [Gammaproteobacteria bacterium]
MSVFHGSDRFNLLGLSPGAWIHVNLLGYYQFTGEGSYEYIERWIQHWHYEEHTGFVEKYRT